MRPDVEVDALADVGRGPPAEMTRPFDDDDGTTFPGDQGRGREPGQAAADDDQVRVARRLFRGRDHDRLLCGNGLPTQETGAAPNL